MCRLATETSRHRHVATGQRRISDGFGVSHAFLSHRCLRRAEAMVNFAGPAAATPPRPPLNAGTPMTASNNTLQARPMTQPPQDGRHLRRQRSRQSIITAMIALVREGTLSPGAEAVAARAGVGLRTVFRHFKDMETLYQEIADQLIAELVPIYTQPYTSSTWQERLLEMAERRARCFDHIMPLKIAADVRRHRSGVVVDELRKLNAFLRKRVVDALPDHLHGDGALVDALDLQLSPDAWIRLRQGQGLSAEAAHRAVIRTVRALINGLGEAPRSS